MNAIPVDKSALDPSGLRLGTPALTTRGLTEKDMDRVVDFIDRGLKLSKEIVAVSGPKLIDVKVACNSDDFAGKICDLREEVQLFSEQFSLPGYPNF